MTDFRCGRGNVATGLQSTVEFSPEAIYWIEKNGRVCYANEQACRSLGYTPEEMLSLFIWDVDPNFSETLWAEHWKKLGIGKKILLETIHSRKDEKTFPVEVSGTQISLGDKEIHAAFVRDITERKKSENVLKENERRFRSLIENIPNIAIQGYTFDRKVIFWNQTSEKLYGYSAQEAYGKDLLDLIIPENLKEKVAQEIRTMFENDEPVAAEELLLKRKNGTAVPILSSHVLLEGPAAPKMSYSFDIDLTNLKKAESVSLKLQQELQQSQKLESIGRLAGGVAHDYNNMLGVIIGYAELAQMKLQETEILREELDEILTAAKRSRDITQQLLAFARKQTLLPQMLDLNEATEKNLNMLKQLLGENITLRWDLKKDLWPVKIDPSQIGHILTNLCLNARDAIDDVGEITLKVENISLDEDFCARHPDGFVPGDYVMLSLSDDGCGIEPGMLKNIFEPFFTTKGVGKGTGLGLAMVYGVVKQSNGFIDVSSAPGEGTTFRIYLPRYCEWPTDDQVHGQIMVPESRGETILVVEDEESLLKLTKAMLLDLGYNIVVASSPGEALRLAEEQLVKIDLLLTDVIMPGMNGRELADRLLLKFPQMKYLFMSGYPENVIANHRILDFEVNFIQKPFLRDEFSARIREILDP